MVQKGFRHSAKSIANMIANHRSKKGYVFPEETKRKISLSHMGKPAWNKGLKTGPMSDESRANMSAARKGKKFSAEHKRKISEALRGRIFSAEHKRLIKESCKGRKYRTGAASPLWKGGRSCVNGYMRVVTPGHPHAAKHGFVYEHRIIIEKIIGRFLLPSEVVHHINKNKADNRQKNLMVLASEHFHRSVEKGKPVPPEAVIFDGRLL